MCTLNGVQTDIRRHVFVVPCTESSEHGTYLLPPLYLPCHMNLPSTVTTWHLTELPLIAQYGVPTHSFAIDGRPSHQLNEPTRDVASFLIYRTVLYRVHPGTTLPAPPSFSAGGERSSFRQEPARPFLFVA